MHGWMRGCNLPDRVNWSRAGRAPERLVDQGHDLVMLHGPRCHYDHTRRHVISLDTTNLISTANA